MKRTFFIVVLAIFFTFDIFFAISTAVADNLKSSPNLENQQFQESQKVILGKQTLISKPLPMTILPSANLNN